MSDVKGWSHEQVRNVIVHHASGPSPTCDERPIANSVEWGLLKTTAVTWNGWNASAHKVPPEQFWGKENLVVRTGDVLITKAGPRNRCGVTVYVTSTPPRLMVSGKMILLRPDAKKINAVVLAGMLATEDCQRFIDSRTTGMADAQLNFTNELLLDTEITIPPLPEQRKIARILTTVDHLIEQTEALIEKYKSIKQGMMHDLFTRGVDSTGQLRLPYEDAPHLYKQSSLGWIPKEWETTTLASVADVGRGKFTVRPRNDPRYYGGPYPFIQTGDVTSCIGRELTSYSQTLNHLGTTVSKVFPKGTILVTIAANIADTAILGLPMYLPDSIVGVVPHTMQDTRYIELCIRRNKSELDAKAPQSAQKNINLEDLRPLLISWPSDSERKRLSDKYESIDSALVREEQQVEKMRTIKTGLMQDLLTGKVRVNVDEAEEVTADV